jgi:hypothetical protein
MPTEFFRTDLLAAVDASPWQIFPCVSAPITRIPGGQTGSRAQSYQALTPATVIVQKCALAATTVALSKAGSIRQFTTGTVRRQVSLVAPPPSGTGFTAGAPVAAVGEAGIGWLAAVGTTGMPAVGGARVAGPEGRGLPHTPPYKGPGGSWPGLK